MITLSVTLSEACNLRCTYCNVDKESKKHINVEAFIEQFYAVRARSPDEIVKIDFFGGEPLLQYSSIVTILERLAGEPNVKYFMPTNGLLLSSERIEYLTHHNVQLSLSFDGLWQDTNRMQPRNKGTLHRYVDMMPLFHSIKNLQVHTMIQGGNYNLLENHIFIYQLTGVNPELTLVRDNGTWSVESVELLKHGITELFEWYTQNVDTEDVPNFIRHYLKHVVLYKVKQHEVKSCGAGETYFSFSENTEIPCNRFKGQPETIKKIPIFRMMPACDTCEVKSYCTKGCLYEQIQNDGPIEELCTIYRHTYAEVFKMIAALKTNPTFVRLLKREISNEY